MIKKSVFIVSLIFLIFISACTTTVEETADCTDSDSLDYTTQGLVQSAEGIERDSCDSNGKLNEIYCEGTSSEIESKDCTELGSNFICFEGYCKETVEEETITVESQVVIVSSLDDHIYGINASSGKELWKYKIGDTQKITPIIYKNLVFSGSANDYL